MTDERGYYGIGVHHPKHEVNIGTLWRTAHIMGAGFVFTVGQRYQRQCSDTVKAWRHTPLLHFTDIDDLLDHLPYSCPLVGVEAGILATHRLSAFVHPERAAYLLGAEDHGLAPDVAERCHHVIEIDAARPLCLNVAVAGSLVLYDRFAKGRVVRDAKRGAAWPKPSPFRHGGGAAHTPPPLSSTA